MTALQRFHSRNVPQTEPLDERQVRNNAGGYSYEADPWTRLRRFLIMGSDGGTYYVGERELTRENLDALRQCADEEPHQVLAMIYEVLTDRLAPKPEYAIYALAFMTAHERKDVRQQATYLIPRVLNIGTHLFQFAEFVENFRGWGSALRKGVGNWYLDKTPRQLAYQVTKYQQRNGWSHRDLLRLSHPKAAKGVIRPADDERNLILRYVTQGAIEVPNMGDYPAQGLEYLRAVDAARSADEKETIKLIEQYGLTREMINTEYLNHKDVQKALLIGMPITALVRNLGNMTRIGVFDNWNAHLSQAIRKLTEPEIVKRSGIHPVTVLNALKTYQQGHGFRGRNTWEPNADIVEALNQTFRLSFKNVEPANKRTLIGLDVSGSMSWSAPAGFDNLSCAEASAAMLMATYESEPFVKVMAFSHEFIELPITRGMDLQSVLRLTHDRNFGGTDCALPMKYAAANGLDIDTFVVYTDSETWAGTSHPARELKHYRQVMNKPEARLIIVAMEANHVSIADPNDAGMLDVVGFDSSAPQIIAKFSAGEL
jgi:60 kDa SS-A/Ro ribonucleoprotein